MKYLLLDAVWWKVLVILQTANAVVPETRRGRRDGLGGENKDTRRVKEGRREGWVE
jgi:hypothetical protein